VARLANLGIHIDSVFDLVNSNRDYQKAIPILIDELDVCVPTDRTFEGIVRALAVKHARDIDISSLLFAKFRSTPRELSSVRWAIGNTIEVIAGADDLANTLQIALDSTAGPARQMFVYTLRRYKSPEVTAALGQLINDPDVGLHAMTALTAHKDLNPEILKKVETLVTSKNKTIRRSAEKLLKRHRKQSELTLCQSARF
jgi:hypothetical protein